MVADHGGFTSPNPFTPSLPILDTKNEYDINSMHWLRCGVSTYSEPLYIPPLETQIAIRYAFTF